MEALVISIRSKGFERCTGHCLAVLFLIFVNDLPDVLSGNVLLFADDVKLISTRYQYGELHQNEEAAL